MAEQKAYYQLQIQKIEEQAQTEIFKLRNKVNELEQQKAFPLCVKCRGTMTHPFDAAQQTSQLEQQNLLQVIRAQQIDQDDLRRQLLEKNKKFNDLLRSNEELTRKL